MRHNAGHPSMYVLQDNKYILTKTKYNQVSGMVYSQWKYVLVYHKGVDSPQTVYIVFHHVNRGFFYKKEAF